MSNDHEQVRASVRRALELVSSQEQVRRWESAELSVQAEAGFAVDHGENATRVSYHALADAMRAALALREEPTTIRAIHAQRELRRLSVMIDMSRNAVMRVETVERYLASAALMGYSTLYLYLEDTYEVPGQPYIGHGRGRYSQDELRRIDDIAHGFGIEVVPVIQTLGHLRQILKWPPFAGIRVAPEVIRIGDEGGLELIRAMISAATAPFRSARVHLGLDEAYGFADGAPDPSDRMGWFLRHVDDVAAICRELGVEPMMWSDMLFDVEHGAKDYYRTDRTIATQTLDALPHGLTLVYWDYFHHTDSYYAQKLRQHQPLPTVMAGGCASWGRLWTRLPESITACTAAVGGAIAAGVDEAMITMWGNDGNECDYFSCLPALAHAADRAYGLTAQETDAGLASLGVSQELWVAASEIDDPFDDTDRTGAIEPPNPSKWLLWLDPLISFGEIGLSDEVAERMHKLGARLSLAETSSGPDRRLGVIAQLCRALGLKTELHLALRPAYLAGDRLAAKRLATELVPEVETAVARLEQAHRDRWLADNKVFGWEVLQRRYAGLLARLASTRRELIEWSEGNLDLIESLEIEPLRVAPDTVSATVPWTVFATPAGMA
ncbi:hypothetical protein [Occultella gossypii]|uniref:Glycoside Hydrolase 20C C-terminal domain-containing protein n=1 Tax=Occultella gossypii TaxID=2800820 RepID=A0ABS7SAQ6_9MICO|nr:hypothetical protein [Occultella gossypii]MBZ2196764.1 hypothetical protein [Occultella gossypii]